MAMSILSSCEHKPLYLRDLTKQTVNIVFDWSDLHEGDEMPKGMTLYCYNDDTEEYLKYDVPVTDDSIQISMYNGNNQIILYNSDMQAVLPSNIDKWDTHTLTSLLPNKSNEPLYGGLHSEFIELKNEGEGKQTITIRPGCLNQHIVATVTGTERVNDVKSWRSTVSGISTNRKVAVFTPGADAKSTTPLMNMEPVDEGVKGEMSTFGTYTIDNTQNHKLIVYAIQPNGNIRYFLFDVTEKVRSQAQKHYIYLNGLNLLDATELQPGDIDYPKGNEDSNSMSPNVDLFEEGGEENIKL